MDYLGTSLTLAGKILDLIPNYEQNQLKKFKALKTAYNVESKRSEDDQDHDLIDWLEDELKPYITKAIEYKQEGKQWPKI